MCEKCDRLIRTDAFTEIAALLERAELGLDRMGEAEFSARVFDLIVEIDSKRIGELPAPFVCEDDQ